LNSGVAGTDAVHPRFTTTYSAGHRAYFYALDQLSYTDGTIPPLLDSTVFVAISEFNDGGPHYQNYVPVIAAGNGLRGGSNLAFPTEFKETFMVPAWARTLPGPKNRTPNDLWQNVLQTLGVYQAGQKFGAPSVTTSPVPGLWV